MFAVLVVLVAIFFGVARILLPHVSDYKTDISSAVSDYIGQPVEVRKLNAEWRGFGPALVLEDFTMLNAEGGKPVLKLSEARLDFNLIVSLFMLQPILSNITLVGADLVLTRDEGGRFSVAGIEGQGEAGEVDSVTQWIFSQGKLRLEKSNIIWRDRMFRRREMRFSSINATLRNSGSRHILDASAILPAELGKSLDVHIDLRGGLLDARGRSVGAYFRGEKLKITEFLRSESIADISANVGEADFQLWLNWKDGGLQKLKGDIDVDNVSLYPVASPAGATTSKSARTSSMDIRRLAGKFSWATVKDGWRFDGNDLLMVRDNYQWAPSRVSISVMNDEKAPSLINAYASHMRLEDAAQFLKLFSVGGDELQTTLAAIKPRGVVHNAHISWQRGNNPGYKAYARLDHATTNAWKFIPATNNMSGQIWLEKNKGQAVLERGSVTLDFPGLFRWPIDVDDMNGQVDWIVDGDGWRLMSNKLVVKNEDISSSASFSLVKDKTDERPFMSLVAQFENGDGSQVAHYLPTGIMHDTTVDWLDTAIKGGHVVSGGTIFHGRLSGFPFDKGDGKFEVLFNVENGQLDYAKDWPPISDIDAEVQFIGRSMLINARKGKIFSNEIKWARVELPDMTVMPLPLLVNGDINGVTQDKLNYLISSPKLHEAIGKYLEGMEVDGKSLLRLNLKIPIGKYEDVSVDGWADLENNSLALPGLGRILSNVKGRLKFRKDGLEMDAERAELLGQPTNLQIKTSKTDENSWMNIHARGAFDGKDMAESYVPTIRDQVNGKGELEVLFNIPLGKQNGSDQVAALDIGADFHGVELKLPSPFNKEADDHVELAMKVDFPADSDPVMKVSYGDIIKGAFRLNEAGIAGIKSGEIRVNGGNVSLPDTSGLRIIGWLDNVRLNDWLDLWPKHKAPPIDQKESLSFVSSIDVAMNKLEAYGQEIHNPRVVATPVADTWHLDINSDELAGTANIPSDLLVYPITGKFDHIYISEPSMAGGGLDPRDLPSLDLMVDDFRYESRKLGSFKLDTTRVANGVRVEQAVLSPKATTIIARGGWYINGDEHSSNIQANVHSTDVGKTLKELDYVGAIEGGEGEVNLNLQWPSALYDIDVGHLKGNMQMLLEHGQLLEIDPGAGRLFGMLSLQMLPRRLFLDFSDVFAKGFGFDQIKGTFSIEEGNAYTKDLRLDGPAAKIGIKGRAGLVEQDYDQLVTVTPKVSESLPVIGALTSTPQIGAVILFFQKLFQPGIEEATRNQYTITGKWNDPKISKVKPAKKKGTQEEKNEISTD